MEHEMFPTDCLGIIIGFIEDQSDFIQFYTVCENWKEYIDINYHVTKHIVFKIDTLKYPDFYYRSLNFFVKKLDLIDYGNLGYYCCDLNFFVNLKSLQIINRFRQKIYSFSRTRNFFEILGCGIINNRETDISHGINDDICMTGIHIGRNTSKECFSTVIIGRKCEIKAFGIINEGERNRFEPSNRFKFCICNVKKIILKNVDVRYSMLLFGQLEFLKKLSIENCVFNPRHFEHLKFIEMLWLLDCGEIPKGTIIHMKKLKYLLFNGGTDINDISTELCSRVRFFFTGFCYFYDIRKFFFELCLCDNLDSVISNDESIQSKFENLELLILEIRSVNSIVLENALMKMKLSHFSKLKRFYIFASYEYKDVFYEIVNRTEKGLNRLKKKGVKIYFKFINKYIHIIKLNEKIDDGTLDVEVY